MNDLLLRPKTVTVNNTNMNQSATPGKIDVRRLEAARNNRQLQLREWEEYDRKMRSLDKKKINRRLSSSEGHVKFQNQYVLFDATLNNDINEVRYLLEHGYNPNLAKDDGLTPLHQACINNNVDMCELLVRFGADVNGRDADQWTPLHTAAACGYIDVCEYLLANHADILAINVDGSIPYDIAEDEETSKFFLDEIKLRGISPADVEEARSRPEKLMARDVMKMYNSGEDLEQLDSQGAAPIHIAAACGYQEVLTLLLRMDVDPDLLDADSWTPAHVAVFWGQLEALEILIAYGADLNRTTPTGQNAFALCDSEEMHARVVMMWEDRERLRARVRNDGSYNASKSLRRRRSTSSVHRSSLREKSNLSKREVMKEVQMAQTNTSGLHDDALPDDTPSETDRPTQLGPRVILINETKHRNPEIARGQSPSDVDSPRSGGSPVMRRDPSNRTNVIHIVRPPTGYGTGSELVTSVRGDDDNYAESHAKPHTGVGHDRNPQDSIRRGVHVLDSRGSLSRRHPTEIQSGPDSRPSNNLGPTTAIPGTNPTGTGTTDTLSQFSVPSGGQYNSLPRSLSGDTNSGEPSPFGNCCRNCVIL